MSSAALRDLRSREADGPKRIGQLSSSAANRSRSAGNHAEIGLYAGKAASSLAVEG
jgi:hypothetical protein